MQSLVRQRELSSSYTCGPMHRINVAVLSKATTSRPQVHRDSATMTCLAFNHPKLSPYYPSEVLLAEPFS